MAMLEINNLAFSSLHRFSAILTYIYTMATDQKTYERFHVRVDRGDKLNVLDAQVAASGTNRENVGSRLLSEKLADLAAPVKPPKKRQHPAITAGITLLAIGAVGLAAGCAYIVAHDARIPTTTAYVPTDDAP